MFLWFTCSSVPRPEEIFRNSLKSLVKLGMTIMKTMNEVLQEISDQINTPNRGSCDYFIVDQIEKIVKRELNNQNVQYEYAIFDDTDSIRSLPMDSLDEAKELLEKFKDYGNKKFYIGKRPIVTWEHVE